MFGFLDVGDTSSKGSRVPVDTCSVASVRNLTHYR